VDFNLSLHLKGMIRIILFLLLSLICSCSLIKNIDISDVVGKYEFTDKNYIYSSIELKPDSTFHLRFEGGWLSSVSSGEWRVKGKQVILNSYHKKHKKGYDIIDYVDRLSDSIVICVIDIHGNKLPFTNVKLVGGNNSKIEILDFKSNIKFLKSSYDSVYIRPFYCPEIGISVSELKNENITIQFDQGSIYYYFSNEKWLIKRNRLYGDSLRKNKFRKENYYKRVDSLNPIISI